MNAMLRTLKFFFTILSAVIIFIDAQAQDLVLSQPYSSPLYLAPSFAGTTDGGRAFLTYRNQWMGINGGYNTALFGIDYFFRRQNSSLGLLLSHDRQVGGTFNTTEIRPQYNYQVEISRDLYFRPGVEFSIYYKTINPNKLVFANQIAVDGTIVDGASIDFNRTGGIDMDVAFSGLLYNKNFWIGIALHHTTETDVTFVNDEIMKPRTPRKWTFLGGYRYAYYQSGYSGLEDAFTATAIIDYQSNYSQFLLGVLWTRMPLELGIWYRDLPLTAKGNRVNRDAIIGSIGLTLENFKISYSYDMTLSKLSRYTAGSHEIVLTIKFDQRGEHDLSFLCY